MGDISDCRTSPLPHSMPPRDSVNLEDFVEIKIQIYIHKPPTSQELKRLSGVKRALLSLYLCG